MSLRIAVARKRALLPIVELGWRLGLGPLLGRPLCLVSASATGDEAVRAVLPYVFAGGDLFVPVVGDRRWVDAATQRPQVMVQAHPGPLSTRARPVTDREHEQLIVLLASSAPDLVPLRSGEWWVLRPTGDPAPSPTLPDLNWVLPALGLAGVAARRVTRRR